jgi:hypothetical protein
MIRLKFRRRIGERNDEKEVLLKETRKIAVPRKGEPHAPLSGKARARPSDRLRIPLVEQLVLEGGAK